MMEAPRRRGRIKQVLSLSILEYSSQIARDLIESLTGSTRFEPPPAADIDQISFSLSILFMFCFPSLFFREKWTLVIS